MKSLLFFIVSILFLSPISYGQDLLKERIWKISSRKKSIFLDKENPVRQKLTSIRNSYVKSRGYERVVLDFSTAQPPQIYGLISKDSKIFIDLFNTDLGEGISSPNHVKYLKNIDFYPIDSKSLSLELSFDKDVSFDIFYLENPGRLVIDIKK